MLNIVVVIFVVLTKNCENMKYGAKTKLKGNLPQYFIKNGGNQRCKI